MERRVKMIHRRMEGMGDMREDPGGTGLSGKATPESPVAMKSGESSLTDSSRMARRAAVSFSLLKRDDFEKSASFLRREARSEDEVVG